MSTSDSVERCGKCGAAAPAGAELCPVCGALLAAYRTPSDAPPAAVDPEPIATVRPPRPLVMASPPPPVVENKERLDEARTRLVQMLVAPEQELLETIAEKRPALPSAASPITVPADRPFGETTTDAPKKPPSPSKVAQERRSGPVPTPALTAKPRRPGFVLTGTVEPVILFGVTFFILACIFALLASLLNVRLLAAVGLLLGAIGVFAVLLAILVALVQWDRERG